MPLPKAVAEAHHAAADGDYEQAITLLAAAVRDAPASERGALSIALAEAYLREERAKEAIPVLLQTISETASVSLKGQATGLLAVSYESLGAWREAVGAFGRYLEATKAAEPDVRWHMALAYRALGQDNEALAQLGAIRLEQQPTARRAEILEEIAGIQRRLLDYDAALATYQRILEFATRADYRALIVLRQGDTAQEAGRTKEAIQVFSRVLQEHGNSNVAIYALQALDRLQAAQVTDLERGQITLRGGQYASAAEALQRHLAAHPQEQLALAHYSLGQAYERLGRYGDAFQAYDLLIQRLPQDPLTPEAWMAKARAVRANGGDPSGTYQEFQRRYPQDSRAPEALWLAAVARERAADWHQAGVFYRQLHVTYPASARAAEAQFREGLAAYARQDLEAGTRLWQESLRGSIGAEERARRLVWLSLAAHARGDLPAARKHRADAIGASPWSYYGWRARDLDATEDPFRPGAMRLPTDVAQPLPESRPNSEEWNAIEEWGQGLPQPEKGLGPAVVDDALARQGAALWQLGWEEEAIAAYRTLRDKVWDNDPAGLIALLRLFSEKGIHSLSISTAERVMALGTKAGASAAPRGLLRMSYPTVFGRLISAESQKRGLDPLLFAALVRQESRFNPRAVSYAGASGLTQVMPQTGAWIAEQLGEEDYRPEQLFRPSVGVRYGVFYLAEALRSNDRDWMAALVVYNAGPGSLARWTAGKPISDHDLFYETIPIAQTRDYVRLIYQQYRTYQSLYRPG